jgi:hypothetical protein
MPIHSGMLSRVSGALPVRPGRRKDERTCLYLAAVKGSG